MSQQPVFKNYQQQGNSRRPESVEFKSGQPRYVPPQRLVKGPAQKEQSVYTKPSTLRTFEGGEAGAAMASVPQVFTKPTMMAIKTRHPHNPFVQQAPIRHSVFNAASVDLNAPAPRSRQQPMRPKYKEQIDAARLGQQSIPSGVDLKPQHGFLRSKNAHMQVKTSGFLGRPQPIAQDSALLAHYQPAKVQTTRAAPQNALGWKSQAPAFKVDQRLYQTVQQQRDYRLEKRKEQQSAYQSRRDQEKQRMNVLYNRVAQIKAKQNSI
jgi:hypothetical protein